MKGATTPPALLVAIVLTGLALLGCGAGGSRPGSSNISSGHPSGPCPTPHRLARESSSLPTADRHLSRRLVLDSLTVRDVVGESRVVIGEVIPATDESEGLVGADLDLYLNPPVKLEEVVLPTVIYPDEAAPSGTPTLRRRARWSAEDVGELEVQVVFTTGVVAVTPGGNCARGERLELVGPPAGPAYASEPGR